MNELLSMVCDECADAEFRGMFFKFLDDCLNGEESLENLARFVSYSGRQYVQVVNMPVFGLGGGMIASLIGGKILYSDSDGEPEIYEDVEAFLRSIEDVGVMSGASLSSDLLSHEELKEIAKIGGPDMEGEHIEIGDTVYLWSKNELYELKKDWSLTSCGVCLEALVGV